MKSRLASSRSSLPRSVKLLGLASLLNDIASEMIFPLLPRFLLGVLGGSLFVLGVIEGTADSTASLLKLWSGSWSDRARHRRGFVIVGYALAAIVRPFIGLTVAPWQVFVIRIVDRAGKGIRTSPRDALIADVTDATIRGRAFGFHRAMDHLGAAIGPLLALGFLTWWPDHLRALFLLTCLPGLLVVGLLLFGLRDVAATSPRKQAEGGAVSSFRGHLTLQPFDRSFRLYLLALMVFQLGNSSDAFLLVRAGELGVPTAMLPVLWCAFHVVKSSGNWLAGRGADRLGPRPLLFLGWAVYAGAYLAFGLATQAWQAWVFFLAYALFYALTEPSERTLVANLTDNEHKGLAYGWYNFAIGSATLPASLIFGALYQVHGALTAFGLGAALALLAALLLAGVSDKKKRSP